jgi:maltose/moltooligosaccharide transporter
MPYAILSGALPAARMGVYMGIFNFFIVIPEITQALTFGPLIRGIFGANNPSSPLYVVLGGGCFMLLAALLVLRVWDIADLAVPEVAVIEGDEQELFIVPEAVQPVPSTGLIDRD